MIAKPGHNGRRRTFPVTYLFPNMITLVGMCAGLSAIRYAMLERWEMAVTFLIIAAVVDGMDGRLARMLNATSTFGAQLDSLADFLSFGVAPVMVMYLWQLHSIRGLGWIIVLFYVICCALRLARFNTRIFEARDAEDEKLADHFFTGVPAPAGAMLCLLPLVLHFQFGNGYFDSAQLVAMYVPCIAVLMASTIPTISIKKFKIKHTMAGIVFILSGLWIAGWIIEPWLTFSLTAMLYFLLLPIGILRYRRAMGQQEELDL